MDCAPLLGAPTPGVRVAVAMASLSWWRMDPASRQIAAIGRAVRSQGKRAARAGITHASAARHAASHDVDGGAGGRRGVQRTGPPVLWREAGRRAVVEQRAGDAAVRRAA